MVLSAGVMGGVSYGFYWLLCRLVSPRIAVLPAILLAIVVYAACVVLFKGVSYDDVAMLPKGKYGRYTMSAIDLVKAVSEAEENVDVTHMGEADFVITFEDPAKKNGAVSVLKTVLVSLVAFFGMGFSIMTFHTDVDVAGLFEKIYEQFTGNPSSGFTVLEVMYSVGIGIGVVFFFNHFGRRRITEDPTPMEVQMRLYEDDVDSTIIEQERRKEKR